MKIRTWVFLATILVVFLLALASCKKKETLETIAPTTDSIIDVDNNYITIVKIGDQWWTAEDLRVSHYKDKSSIALLDQAAEWAGKVPGYNKSNSAFYGYYYNLAAIKHPAGLAPEGWHVATDEDWKKLESYIGISGAELDKTGWRGTDHAGKLKIASPKGWPVYQNVWSQNQTGFSGMPSGCIFPPNKTGDENKTAFWWTSTSTDTLAYYRYLDYKNNLVFREKTGMNYGMCVRCVKD